MFLGGLQISKEALLAAKFGKGNLSRCAVLGGKEGLYILDLSSGE